MTRKALLSRVAYEAGLSLETAQGIAEDFGIACGGNQNPWVGLDVALAIFARGWTPLAEEVQEWQLARNRSRQPLQRFEGQVLAELHGIHRHLPPPGGLLRLFGIMEQAA